jgi:peptide deformylase
MILPIVAYGDPVLRKKAVDIDKNYPNLSQVIADMFETMYESNGVGLAAPQIGLGIRLFVIDGAPFGEDEVKDFKQVFINAKIRDESGEEWKFNEGCLSIPGIREDILRKEELHIEFMDENWKKHQKTFHGIAARIIQHEYDHIEGVLFTDRISPFRKRLLRNRLADISRGEVDVDYKMRFPVKGNKNI